MGSCIQGVHSSCPLANESSAGRQRLWAPAFDFKQQAKTVVSSLNLPTFHRTREAQIDIGSVPGANKVLDTTMQTTRGPLAKPPFCSMSISLHVMAQCSLGSSFPMHMTRHPFSIQLSCVALAEVYSSHFTVELRNGDRAESCGQRGRGTSARIKASAWSSSARSKLKLTADIPRESDLASI